MQTIPEKTEQYIPSATQFDSRWDTREIDSGRLVVKFGERPPDRQFPSAPIIPGSVLTCWPFEGEIDPDCEAYPDNTTTIDGILFNSRGVLTLPE